MYNLALSEAKLDQRVLRIREDKKLGLVAVLDSNKSEIDSMSIGKVLGGYVFPWEWGDK